METSHALALVDALPAVRWNWYPTRYCEVVNGCTVAAVGTVCVAIRGDGRCIGAVPFGSDLDVVRKAFAVEGQGRWLKLSDVRAAAKVATTHEDTRLVGKQRLVRIDGVAFDARLLKPVLTLAGRWCGAWVAENRPCVFTGDGWCVAVMPCRWAPARTPRICTHARKTAAQRVTGPALRRVRG